MDETAIFLKYSSIFSCYYSIPQLTGYYYSLKNFYYSLKFQLFSAQVKEPKYSRFLTVAIILKA